MKAIFWASGLNSVKAGRFSTAVPQHEVINLSGFPSLCVLIVPKALPGLALLFTTQLAMFLSICPLCSHLLLHSEIVLTKLALGSASSLLYIVDRVF